MGLTGPRGSVVPDTSYARRVFDHSGVESEDVHTLFESKIFFEVDEALLDSLLRPDLENLGVSLGHRSELVPLRGLDSMLDGAF